MRTQTPKRHLLSRLYTWLQWIGQKQLQDQTRNIYCLGLGATFIRGLTVFIIHASPTHLQAQQMAILYFTISISEQYSAILMAPGGDEFLNRKYLFHGWISLQFVPRVSIENYDNGLARNRRHPIGQFNNVPAYCCIYSPIGLNELNRSRQIRPTSVGIGF